MAQTSDYTGLITSEHAAKPKFSSLVAAVARPFADLQNFLVSIPASFDLDQAIGAQLDAVGRWVGASRNVRTPISGVYFSLDTENVGFDQGVWQGPFDPSFGVTTLDDETYRLLIRAKIGVNHWDGTLQGSAAILNNIFSGATQVFIQDNGDMSITIGVAGQIPSTLFLALLSGGYVPIKPEGVHVALYLVTSGGGSPIFGFDVQNTLVSGFDTGAWAIPLSS